MDLIEEAIPYSDWSDNDAEAQGDKTSSINSTFQHTTSLSTPQPSLAPSLMSNSYSSDSRLNGGTEIRDNFPRMVISSPPKPAVMNAPSLITRSSSSTLNSQTKSAPADPLTTRHEVGHIPLANSSTASFNDAASDLTQLQLPSTPMQSQAGFFENVKKSLPFGKDANEPVSSAGPDGDSIRTGDDDSTTGSKNGESPNIISYRRNRKVKGRRGTSTSSFDYPALSPLNEDSKPYVSAGSDGKIADDSFSTANYVDEKFKSTNYRYASEERNNEFHRLFKSVPTNERLLDSFSCALSREILLQGRLFVSEHNICFNSNLLGWITNLIIPFYDILNFEKTATAGLFQNGIAINLKNNGGKHSFATFLSRDSTYNMLQDTWTAANDEAPDIKEDITNDSNADIRDAVISKGLSPPNETPLEEYNHALMEIDGVSPVARRYSEGTEGSYFDDEEDDEEDDENFESEGTSSESRSVIKQTNQKVYKLREDSIYEYDGPYSHHSTEYKYDHASHKETILATENLKCPPGVLFEIIFGEKNLLTLELLKSQDGADFSEFGEYKANDEGKKERSYRYEKGLNYGVGPKSTTCYVTETIEHLDYHGYINVVNTTQTPNVPSGSAFTVKTRYIITWGEKNTSQVVVSFWVNWTGSSWMKGVIERSCKSGQEVATKALVKLLEEAVDKNTVVSSENVDVADIEIAETEEEKVEVPSTVVHELETENALQGRVPLFQLLVVSLLVIIVVLQVLMILLLARVSKKAPYLPFLQENPRAEDALFKGEEMLLWRWIEERKGNLGNSQQEKTRLLKDEIDDLIAKWANGDLNTPVAGQLMEQLEENLSRHTQCLDDEE